MRIAVIGGGNMGSAMVNAWLNKKVCKASDILVYDRKFQASNPKSQTNFKIQTCLHIPNGSQAVGKVSNFKVRAELDNFSLLKKYDVVVLAVKPQDISGVLDEIKTHLSKKTIIISIAAGITIKHIASILGKAKIVRSMPNMPAQINMGIAGWSANTSVTEKDKKIVAKLLGATGYEMYFSDENKLDIVTAVSGSGPAYVFYFMEALFEAGHKLGLTNEEATALAMGTFIGSSLMVSASGESPMALREKVTSKKGTTEAAIKVFDKKKLKKIIFEGVESAYKRAKELNQ